jgi:arylformamidase
MYIRISYTIRTDAPTSSDDVKPMVIHPLQRIAAGDLSNLSRIEITNHSGTHIDAPNHFNATGRRLVNFPIEDFIFTRPVVIDVPKTDNELITPSDLSRYEERLAACDLLLIRTGFSQYRSTDPERYRWNTPGVSPEAAQYLMDRLQNLRALGLDFISLEWTKDLPHNYRAHQILLGDNEHPMMIIEDMNLDFGDLIPRRVYAFPLFFDELDSSPCTVVGEFD